MNFIRDHRLRKRNDYVRVQKKGARCYTPAFVLISMPLAQGHDESRYGLTVSRKTGNSVVRHRIKRRLRAVVHLEQEPLRRLRQDTVLIARREAKTRPFALLRRDLRVACTRIAQ